VGADKAALREKRLGVGFLPVIHTSTHPHFHRTPNSQHCSRSSKKAMLPFFFLGKSTQLQLTELLVVAGRFVEYRPPILGEFGNG
jgi:hypothetical protein